MEITVTTSYTAQELQQQLNPNGAIMCIVIPGDQPHQYVVIVDNEVRAILVKGMLKHLGIEVQA